MVERESLLSLVRKQQRQNKEKIGNRLIQRLPNFYYESISPYISAELEANPQLIESSEKCLRQEASRLNFDPQEVLESFDKGLEILYQQEFKIARQHKESEEDILETRLSPTQITEKYQAYVADFILMLRFLSRLGVYPDAILDIAQKTYRNGVDMLRLALRSHGDLPLWVVTHAFQYYLSDVMSYLADVKDDYLNSLVELDLSPLEEMRHHNQAIALAAHYQKPVKETADAIEHFKELRALPQMSILSDGVLRHIIISCPATYKEKAQEVQEKIANMKNLVAEYGLPEKVIRRVITHYLHQPEKRLNTVQNLFSHVRQEYSESYIPDTVIYKVLIGRGERYKQVLENVRHYFPLLLVKYGQDVPDSEILRVIIKNDQPDLRELDLLAEQKRESGRIGIGNYEEERQKAIQRANPTGETIYLPARETYAEIYGSSEKFSTSGLSYYERVAKHLKKWQPHWKKTEKKLHPRLPALFYHKDFINWVKSERDFPAQEGYVNLKKYLQTRNRLDLYQRIQALSTRHPELISNQNAERKKFFFVVSEADVKAYVDVIEEFEQNDKKYREEGYLPLKEFFTQSTDPDLTYSAISTAVDQKTVRGFTHRLIFKGHTIYGERYIHVASALETYSPLNPDEMYMEPNTLRKVLPGYDEEVLTRIYRTSKNHIRTNPEFGYRHHGRFTVINKPAFLEWVREYYGTVEEREGYIEKGDLRKRIEHFYEYSPEVARALESTLEMGKRRPEQINSFKLSRSGIANAPRLYNLEQYANYFSLELQFPWKKAALDAAGIEIEDIVKAILKRE